MRFLICGDVHWSEFSSILRKIGDKYSKRLENLINSINWVEEQAEENNVDAIIYAGDFFDKTTLNANEITALQEITWANIPHKFIVGNHEGLTSTLNISTTHLFTHIPNCEVISEPTIRYRFGCKIVYLPYIIEKERKPLKEYLKDTSRDMITQEVKQTYVISHNDIKMFYGNFESKEGFNLDEIDSLCHLFINGHIHNYSKFSKVGINIGNITGQNFSEDASKYPHHVMILDTYKDNYEFIVNPFAYNFYKLEFSNIEDLKSYPFLDNSVVSVKIPEDKASEAREFLENSSKLREFRIISVPKPSDGEDGQNDEVIASVNHLEEFVKFISSNFEVTDVMREELREVCKE